MNHPKPPRKSEATREKPVQPDPAEQSGSTGRPTGDGTARQGKDSGQGRYGQSGLGGSKDSETAGQASYRRSGAGADSESRSTSNPGSGRVEHEEREYGGEDPAKRPGEESKLKKDSHRRVR
jgi:hypothetical protein